MSTPNVVPEGHVCHAPAIVPDCTDYTCGVCGRRWHRTFNEVLKEGGNWVEVEPGHPLDTETDGYWSGPTLSLVQAHWHSGQDVVARAEVEPYPGRHVAGTGPLTVTLTRAKGDPDRYSVFRFWRGPNADWCCTVVVEGKPYHVAIQEFQIQFGRAVAAVKGE